ncbi:MAG: nitrilase family protein [Verrucomicrobiota bacterium]|jgi:predicted amidohydrolase|nr:nitrilase family protein [Verrucomicrobiota bacterium]
MNDLRAAAVQFQHQPGDKSANLKIVREYTAKAAAQGVNLVVFPEMCITGYWHLRDFPRADLEALAEPVPDGETTQALLALAKEHELSVGAGFIERGKEGRLFNTYVVAMPDGRTAKHRKLHTFINQHMDSGDDYTVFDLPDGTRVGILICYDCNLGENVRITALKGAEVLLAPHQTGGCNTPSPRCMGAIDVELWENRDTDPAAIEAELKGPKGREWIMKWMPARAHDNGIFIIYSNGVGRDDNEVRTGNSMILDPYGDLLAETWKADNDMVVADLKADTRHMCTGVRWIRSRRPELYGTIATPTGREKDIRTVRFSHEDS